MSVAAGRLEEIDQSYQVESGGNSVTTAAGVVSVRELTAERIAIMHGQAEELDRRLAATAERLSLSIKVRRIGSLLHLTFASPGDATEPGRAVTELNASFHLAAMNRGVYLSARGLVALSTVVTAEDLDDIAARLATAMEDLRKDQP